MRLSAFTSSFVIFHAKGGVDEGLLFSLPLGVTVVGVGVLRVVGAGEALVLSCNFLVKIEHALYVPVHDPL